MNAAGSCRRRSQSLRSQNRIAQTCCGLSACDVGSPRQLLLLGGGSLVRMTAMVPGGTFGISGEIDRLPPSRFDGTFVASLACLTGRRTAWAGRFDRGGRDVGEFSAKGKIEWEHRDGQVEQRTVAETPFSIATLYRNRQNDDGKTFDAVTLSLSMPGIGRAASQPRRSSAPSRRRASGVSGAPGRSTSRARDHCCMAGRRRSRRGRRKCGNVGRRV
jgi:hypothetical protein